MKVLRERFYKSETLLTSVPNNEFVSHRRSADCANNNFDRFRFRERSIFAFSIFLAKHLAQRIGTEQPPEPSHQNCCDSRRSVTLYGQVQGVTCAAKSDGFLVNCHDIGQKLQTGSIAVYVIERFLTQTQNDMNKPSDQQDAIHAQCSDSSNLLDHHGISIQVPKDQSL